jgi:hypothetical protein
MLLTKPRDINITKRNLKIEYMQVYRDVSFITSFIVSVISLFLWKTTTNLEIVVPASILLLLGAFDILGNMYVNYRIDKETSNMSHSEINDALDAVVWHIRNGVKIVPHRWIAVLFMVYMIVFSIVIIILRLFIE